MRTTLQATIDALVVPGKGILAADESTGTIAKRFASIGVASTEASRRDYRQLLLETPGLGEAISGVILYTETLDQCTASGTPLPALAEAQGMVPGVKVDKGLIPWGQHGREQVTRGFDTLPEVLEQYKAQGARFAKWRAVITISEHTPTRACMAAAAQGLAWYARVCQDHGVVPIVEPEVLMDGHHTLEQSAAVTDAVLQRVFQALDDYDVALEQMVLKPNMVLDGLQRTERASPEAVAEATLCVLKRRVPAAVPGIFFLSGGQTPEMATEHLRVMNAGRAHPWLLSFSYGRALQEPCLKAWQGHADHRTQAQAVLLAVSQRNAQATRGTQ